MNRKGLAVGLILLLIGTSIIPITAQNAKKASEPTSRGNWLYVGGSGPGNYTKIQYAINYANDGDTVFVFDDSSPYIERLRINTKITLIGENQATTFINSPGYEMNDSVITIRANNISVSGFTINIEVHGISVLADNAVLTNLCFQGGGSTCIKFIRAKNTFISQITIKGAQFGIDTYYDGYSSDTTIEHCLFLNCTSFAIHVDSSDCIIRDNTLLNCHSGIILISNRNKVLNNTIIAGGLPSGIWVESKNNIISGNVLIKTGFDLRYLRENIFTNNTVNGKPFVYLDNAANQTIDNAGQVILVFCTHMTIKNLEIGYCQIGILLSETTNSIVQNCTVFNCNEGITLGSAYDNIIRSSTITGCGCGINLIGGSRNNIDNNTVSGGGIVIVSSDTLISSNQINASDVGIYIGYPFDYTPSYRNNTVKHNTISQCKEGLLLEYSLRNTITQNNFVKNKRQATFQDSNHNNWTQNYWGRPMNHPKIIFGSLVTIEFDWGYSTFGYMVPWINLDKLPAQEPYDIPVMS